MTEIKADLSYTEEHEWLLVTGTEARIGITAHAAKQLGEIVFVDLPQVGDTFEKGDVMCEIESTKSVGELFAPAAVEVTAVNAELESHPELINQAPYGSGWIVEVTLNEELPELLDADEYRAVLS